MPLFVICNIIFLSSSSISSFSLRSSSIDESSSMLSYYFFDFLIFNGFFKPFIILFSIIWSFVISFFYCLILAKSNFSMSASCLILELNSSFYSFLSSSFSSRVLIIIFEKSHIMWVSSSLFPSVPDSLLASSIIFNEFFLLIIFFTYPKSIFVRCFNLFIRFVSIIIN